MPSNLLQYHIILVLNPLINILCEVTLMVVVLAENADEPSRPTTTVNTDSVEQLALVARFRAFQL